MPSTDTRRSSAWRAGLAALVTVAFVVPLALIVSGSLRPAGLPPSPSLSLVPQPATLHNYLAVFETEPLAREALVSLLTAAIPLMAPFLLVIAARDLTLGLQASFAPALLLTDGGPPPHATTYLPFFIYRSGFAYLRFGESAAATMYVVAFVASLLWLTYVLVGRRILALVVAPTPAKSRPST
jgi:ABC-type sugar transport system permease subunit